MIIGPVDYCKPELGQFIFKIFLAEKPNGRKRSILVLEELNKFIEAPHLKLEDHHAVCRLLWPNCYASTMDLGDAYYLLPIYLEHRRYLRLFIEGILYLPIYFTSL